MSSAMFLENLGLVTQGGGLRSPITRIQHRLFFKLGLDLVDFFFFQRLF